MNRFIKKKDHLLHGTFFADCINNLYCTWSVHVVEEGWDVLATSRDGKGLICNEMIKAIGRPVYGSQLHPEVAKPFSCSKGILINFLTLAVERAKSLGIWVKD